jgi:hypothetical protein
MSNNFLPFCPTDTGTNLLTQVDYAAAADRTNGNQPGVASSKLNNKAIRQATFITSQLAQYVGDLMGVNTLDDGVTATWLSQLKASLVRLDPKVSNITSGPGTFYRTYYFFISTGSATSGATYTNNTFTYTISATVSGALMVRAVGTGVPTASGTLTKASGTGDSTLTFQAYRTAVAINVIGVGGGGGGGGSSTASASNASAGTGGTGTTVFGGAISCSPGNGGSANSGNSGGGAGGSASLGGGAVGIAIAGSGGCGGDYSLTANNFPGGRQGGATPLGGAGKGGPFNVNPTTTSDAVTTSGSGGGSAGAPSAGCTGGSGGAGGYCNAWLYGSALVASYAYTLGSGGGGGAGGTSGWAGGAGADGQIVVIEYFQ